MWNTNTRNARAIGGVIALAAFALSLYCAHNIYVSFADRWAQAEQADQLPDSPEAAELLGSFPGVLTAGTIIGLPSCESSLLSREAALAGTETTLSRLDQAINQARHLLDSVDSLTAKDRRLIAEWSTLIEDHAGTLRRYRQVLRGCTVRPADTTH